MPVTLGVTSVFLELAIGGFLVRVQMGELRKARYQLKQVAGPFCYPAASGQTGYFPTTFKSLLSLRVPIQCCTRVRARPAAFEVMPFRSRQFRVRQLRLRLRRAEAIAYDRRRCRPEASRCDSQQVLRQRGPQRPPQIGQAHPAAIAIAEHGASGP